MRVQFGAAICSAMIGIVVLSSPSFAQRKTVRGCQEEWRANKTANQVAGVTEKAYVEKCRAGSATVQPAAKPAAAPAKPAATRSDTRTGMGGTATSGTGVRTGQGPLSQPIPPATSTTNPQQNPQRPQNTQGPAQTNPPQQPFGSR